jgi:4a-hydroxytetrahydrobiopterin dehydratase
MAKSKTKAPATPPAPRLSDDQIRLELGKRPEWTETGEAIQRTFAFKNFVEAMGFVNKVAQLAEAVNHHPDLLIRYNKVTLTLSTHDSGGITQKDFDLAGAVDALLPA